MVPRERFGELTVEQIDKEIEERREMMSLMVGWLYPRVLAGEIDELVELRAAVVERSKQKPNTDRRDSNLRDMFGC